MSDLIKWFDLWERQRRGNTEGQVYLAGAVAGLKVVAFKRHNPSVEGPHWTVFVAERQPRDQAATRPLPEPRPPQPATAPRQAFGSAADQQKRTDELAGAFDRQGPDNVDDLYPAPERRSS
jgi:hypothetical protein